MNVRGRFIEVRIVLSVLIAVLCGGVVYGTKDLLALSSSWPLYAAGASVLGAAISAWRFFRPVHDILRALDHGLLGLRERDYGLRLTVPAGGVLEGVAERFNALGGALQAERNDLYQKEMMLATVVETAPMAILLSDEAGLVALDNSAARDLFLGGKRIKGHRIREVLAGCPEALRNAVLGTVDGLISVDTGDEVETFHVSNRFFEINTEQHTLHLVRPVTREVARQELEVWKKTIRIINHELNSSLAPISSLIHSARKIVERPDQLHLLHEVFATIDERAQHLGAFLEGYARFARLPPPQKTKVEWPALVRRLEPIYPTAMPAELPAEPAHFDAGQIEQVLINLLKNAAEAGGPLEEVKLSVKSDAPRGVFIAVEDRGAGMSDEVMKKALVPFFTTKAAGTGLGLPLSREIVEAHGGTLVVQRRHGGGTSVTCWLPAE